ncbi:MAG: acyl-CoA dehydrogenase family protein [Solirubrobacterales bacterium]
MYFDLNDEEQAIKDTAREFLASRFPPAKVRELAESRTYDEDLTKQIVDLGWTGIAIPEAHGGQGLGMVALAALCEELGYACAPSPFLGSVGAALLLTAGSEAQQGNWLPKLASGEAAGGFGDPTQLFCDVPGADVVIAFDDDGARVASGAEAGGELVETIDATRIYGRAAEASGEELGGDLVGARARLTVAIAAELTGVAQRAMEMAVSYARERQQFDRQIGAYQGVAHRCATMLQATEEARSLTYYAAWTADAEPDSLPLGAAMAGSRAADAAWEVATSALQVFGGIGFTWEHDLQFWLKRARATGRMLDTPGVHREHVAELCGLGAKVPAAV